MELICKNNIIEEKSKVVGIFRNNKKIIQEKIKLPITIGKSYRFIITYKTLGDEGYSSHISEEAIILCIYSDNKKWEEIEINTRAYTVSELLNSIFK